jgi:tetratricopeptide (TPR) repeat protein
LFATEVLHAMQERGDLIQDAHGRWVTGPALNWELLPPKVEGVIEERTGRLEDVQREILAVASVEGEEFTAQVIARVQKTDEREVIRQLSGPLERQHRLVSAREVRRVDGLRLSLHRFQHNLFQRHFYDHLNAVQRAYLHEDVGYAMEGLYADHPDALASLAPQLARHFQEAGVFEKAVDYLGQAGERAMRLLASTEAAQHFSRALSLLAEFPESRARDRQELTIQSNLGQALTTGKGTGVPEVGVAYTRALALARQLGETRQMIQLLVALTDHAWMRAELAVAQAYGEECLRLATEDQDPELLMGVNKILHTIAQWTGRHGDAVAYNERVIAFYHTHRPSLACDDAIHLAYALGKSGANLVACGYPDRAVRQAQEGLALMQRHDHQPGTVSCLSYLAYIHLLRGEWQQALQFTKEAIDAAHTYGLVQLRTFNELIQGVALARLGELEAGIRLVRQAVAEREAIDSPAGNWAAQARLAEACGRAGRVAEGLALVNGALADLEVTNDRETEAKMHQIKGDLLLLQDLAGDELAATRQEAEGCFRRAVEIAHSHQAKLWEARALASLCRLLHAQGRGDAYACRQQLAELYAWFSEGFETEDLQVVRTVLHELT